MKVHLRYDLYSYYVQIAKFSNNLRIHFMKRTRSITVYVVAMHDDNVWNLDSEQ